MQQRERIIMCSTMEVATEVWRRAQRIPDVWIKAKRNPLSLTCINSVEYIFRAKTQGQRAVKGYHANIIGVDEFISPQILLEDTKNESLYES